MNQTHKTPFINDGLFDNRKLSKCCCDEINGVPCLYHYGMNMPTSTMPKN